MHELNRARNEGGGILGSLARDVRGATLAIMCAALIPFCGMVGGGIDLGRMYITKTRLQHACDAGTLAGRKQMGSGVWGDDDRNAANKFFDANYRDGSYGTSNLTRSFTENAGKVTGVASAIVPMTLMRVLGHPNETLSVSCDSEMRLPNTDIMFVLDTTGSMGQKAVSTDADSKIDSLKKSVKCFYEIVAKLDTDATCAAGAPSGGTGNQVQIRFGFMPYSTNVNVGHLLPSSYFADKWTYPSRQAVYKTVRTYSFDSQGTPTLTGTSDSAIAAGTYIGGGNGSQSACAAATPASSSTYATSSEDVDQSSVVGPNKSAQGDTQTTTYRTTQNYKIDTYWYYTYNSSASPQCKVYRLYGATFTRTRSYSRTDNGTPHDTQVFDTWQYKDVEYDVSKLKSGSDWVPGWTFNAPIGASGQPTPINWDGCIEEAQTVKQSSYSPIPTGANDLNIDLKPDGSAATQWKPALSQLVYVRQVMNTNYSQVNTATVNYAGDYNNGGKYYCPTEAKKLQAWPDATAFDNYVDSLNPTGNTYHDIGMIWGARFMSPDGIFATENKLTPQGGEIDRHMIFMTDGDAQASGCDYSAYGVQFFGGRTTNDVGSTSDCNAAYSTGLTSQVESRLEGLCTAVKNKNITLWVISFGSGSNKTTETRLSNCATSGRYFAARNSAQLQATFASIANQISQLRLTQ